MNRPSTGQVVMWYNCGVPHSVVHRGHTWVLVFLPPSSPPPFRQHALLLVQGRLVILPSPRKKNGKKKNFPSPKATNSRRQTNSTRHTHSRGSSGQY